MNILTFDIEEWFFEYGRGSKPEKMAELDSYLNAILETSVLVVHPSPACHVLFASFNLCFADDSSGYVR